MESLAALPNQVADLASRFDGFETRLTAVEGQIVQLRTDMNAGFSATREDLGRRMRVLHEDVIARIALLGERLNGRSGPRADRTSKRRKG